MSRRWSLVVAVFVAVLSPVFGSARAQGTGSVNGHIGSLTCPVFNNASFAQMNCSSGGAIAAALTNSHAAGGAGSSNAGANLASAPLGAFAQAVGTWSDVLTWGDPRVAQVVFSFLAQGFMGAFSGALPGSGSWASSVFSVWLPGGAPVSSSLYMATGTFAPPGSPPSVRNNSLLWKPALALPTGGLTSLAFTYGWDLQAYGIGNASAYVDFENINLNRIFFLDDQGRDITGNVGYTLANGTNVTDITPEPEPLLLFGSGLSALLLLTLRRRRRAG